MNTVGIRVNTVTKAASNYVGLTYNSLAVMSNILLGANESGIFKMNADTATTAYFETKHFDFGLSQAKQLRTVYLSGILKGGLNVISVLDGTETETVVIPYESSVTEKTYVVNFSSENRGRTIGIKVANTSGLDFSVDNITIIFSVTNSKWEEVYLVGRIKGDVPDMTISASGT